MVLEEGVQQLVQEVLVLLIGECLEEVGYILRDGQLEPPFLIVEAALDERQQVLHRAVWTHDITQVHYSEHNPRADALVVVFEERGQNGDAGLDDVGPVYGSEEGDDSFNQGQLDCWYGLLVGVLSCFLDILEEDGPRLLLADLLRQFGQLNERNSPNLSFLVLE